MSLTKDEVIIQSSTDAYEGSEVPIDRPAKRGFIRRVLGSGHTDTSKGLKSRHITFLALGGAIGTGVFFAIGGTVAQAGPGGALVIYGITGIFVIAVVVCLCEMTCYIPETGAFQNYGGRFVDQSFGFALGINYYLQWAFSIPSEVSAANMVIQYWAKDTPAWVWCFVSIFPIFFIQLLNVKVYGEVEYWSAIIKVLLVVVFIIVGLLFDWGAVPTAAAPSPGLSNFNAHDSFIGGFAGLFSSGYAFYSFGGTELVALTAGETQKPWKSIPKAAKNTFWRIIIFMILLTLVIGLCLNANDPRLVGASDSSDISISPITLIFEMAGFKAARHLVNAILLVAILSSINACFYAATRMLMAMARNGQFFPVFAWTTKAGVPLAAELLTLGISCLVFLTTIWGNGVVFTWFVNLCSASAIITWMSVGAMSIRFRLALKAQAIPESDLAFRQWGFPILPLVCLSFGGFLFAGMGYSSVKQEPFNWRNPFGTFLGVIVLIVCYVGWKVTHWRTDNFKSLVDVDLQTNVVWARGEGKLILDAEKARAYKKRLLAKESGILGRISWYTYWAFDPLEARRQHREAQLQVTESHSSELDAVGSISKFHLPPKLA